MGNGNASPLRSTSQKWIGGVGGDGKQQPGERKEWKEGSQKRSPSEWERREGEGKKLPRAKAEAELKMRALRGQLHFWSFFYILTPTHPYVGWGVGDLRNKSNTLSEAEFKEMGLASEREARAG